MEYDGSISYTNCLAIDPESCEHDQRTVRHRSGFLFCDEREKKNFIRRNWEKQYLNHWKRSEVGPVTKNLSTVQVQKLLSARSAPP